MMSVPVASLLRTLSVHLAGVVWMQERSDWFTDE